MTNKITVTDLLKNKEKYAKKESVKADVYIKRLDGNITIEKPSRSLVMESLEMAYDDNQKMNADPFLVYNVIVEPDLKDKELQKEYECVEPMDIVSKIFEPGEISRIAQFAVELAGYGESGVEMVKELKN